MPSTIELFDAVHSAFASKRVGQPTFVRCSIQSEAMTLGEFAGLFQEVEKLLQQNAARILRTGSFESGAVTLLIEGEGGAAALLAWTRGNPRPGGVDILALGNRGAIYHDAGHANSWEEFAGLRRATEGRYHEGWLSRAMRESGPVAAPERRPQ